MHGSKSEYSFRRPTTFSHNFVRNSDFLSPIREGEENVRLIETSAEKLKKSVKKISGSLTTSAPKKSATFHGLHDLNKCRVQLLSSEAAPSSGTSSQYKQKVKRLHSQPTTCSASSNPPSSSNRKKSIFYEMGERIRLFSTASFVTPAAQCSSNSAVPRGRCSDVTSNSVAPLSTTVTQTVGTAVIGLAKSHSLNSFDDGTAPVFVSTTRCPTGSKVRSFHHQIPEGKRRIDNIGSLLSLPGNEENLGMEPDLEKGLEKDVSQLGILCHHCSTTDLSCPKTQKELPSPSASSVYSLARSDMSNEPLCRICHCCWPPDSNDPLISPCRCSGSLQYVHVSCLMHWLDISSRKLHRPAICELCLYKYRRRRVLKYREMKLPQCAQADVRYYTLFVVAILLMILSAFATVVCFQLEKSYGLQGGDGRNRSSTPLTVEGVASDASLATDTTTTSTVVLGSRKRIGDISVSASSSSSSTYAKDEYNNHRRDETENILSTVTLIAAMVFFLSFFLAMYAHVKSGLSFCGYLTLCWSSNLEWSIEEYKHSRDTQYLNKLEELRRKINEKQKKAADEVEPLRSSVIVLE